ncbi:MAG TPA: hypothetical protein VG366_04420 [Solirubrobacteraceae bacterium]|nr:hypothetical protein [Solirubrobacteraceae bacterium]
MRRIHTTHTRDAALRQLNRINRWLIAGSVVLTAVLADVAANAFPGKTTKTRAAPKAAKAHKKSSGSAAKTTTGVLRAPAQSPQASEAQSSQPAAPSEPAQEAAPAAPAQESAPAQEASSEPAPEREAAPAQEAAPTQEAAPEESAPVVSGGS